MNTEILKKYNITFLFDVHRGERRTDCQSVLSTFMYLFRNIEDLTDVLNDVDNCINGNFNLVPDPYGYFDSLFQIYSELTPTTLELFGIGGVNRQIIPLSEFREILLSWKEYLMQG